LKRQTNVFQLPCSLLWPSWKFPGKSPALRKFTSLSIYILLNILSNFFSILEYKCLSNPSWSCYVYLSDKWNICMTNNDKSEVYF
jgi:hypothetical protein